MAILFCLLPILNTTAHSLGQSYLYFQVYDQAIETRVEITVEDINQALNLNLPTNQEVTKEDVEPHLEKIRDYIDENLMISNNQQEYPLKYQGYGQFETGFARYLTFKYRLDNLVEIPQTLDVDYRVLLDVKPKHKNLVVIEHNWKTGTFANESSVSLIFTANSSPQTLDLSSSSLLRGFISVVQLGFLHIWEGIDHILFLIALILPSVLRRENLGWQPVKNFRPAFFYVIKIATAFTIAHSITLALATFQIVEVPSRIVESIIALSIAIAAIDIIYPIFGRRIWLIIFGFGLFHGFGFANVLAELGIVQEHALLSLFGFNLGIELGQIAIIAIIFPILYLCRQQKIYTKFIVQSGAAFLFIVAIYWLIERAFEVDLHVLALVKQIF
ncbi:MAG: HupE/UreJ family protein [Crocosphaera sp.]|nr:HupE/UreJ family protein [Crocosphaera sp.]